MQRGVREIMAPIRALVGRADTLRRAAEILSEARTGFAVVEEEPAAVFTERDLLRAVASGVDLDRAVVADHMGREPAVPDSMLVDQACALMIKRNVRHLLVHSEEQGLVGVLNMRDVVGVLSGAARMGAVPPARDHT